MGTIGVLYMYVQTKYTVRAKEKAKATRWSFDDQLTQVKITLSNDLLFYSVVQKCSGTW